MYRQIILLWTGAEQMILLVPIRGIYEESVLNKLSGLQVLVLWYRAVYVVAMVTAEWPKLL